MAMSEGRQSAIIATLCRVGMMTVTWGRTSGRHTSRTAAPNATTSAGSPRRSTSAPTMATPCDGRTIGRSTRWTSTRAMRATSASPRDSRSRRSHHEPSPSDGSMPPAARRQRRRTAKERPIGLALSMSSGDHEGRNNALCDPRRARRSSSQCTRSATGASQMRLVIAWTNSGSRTSPAWRTTTKAPGSPSRRRVDAWSNAEPSAVATTVIRGSAVGTRGASATTTARHVGSDWTSSDASVSSRADAGEAAGTSTTSSSATARGRSSMVSDCCSSVSASAR